MCPHVPTRVVQLQAFVCAPSADGDLYDEVDCSRYVKCLECTNEIACGWSSSTQRCVHLNKEQVPLTVYKPTDCPRVSAVRRTAAASSGKVLRYQYAVRIDNDFNGHFQRYLGRRNLTCAFGGRPGVTAAHVVDGNTVVCEPVEVVHATLYDMKVYNTYHSHVMFDDGVVLRLDDDADHYTSFLRDDCGDNDDHCVTCLWYDVPAGYRYYVKLCSSANRCVGRAAGRFEYFDRRSVADLSPATGSVGPVVHVGGGCPDAHVVSVLPESGPWIGHTDVTVTVRNHAVLADNRYVNVTVAGRVCANPTPGPDGRSVTCTVADWTAADGRRPDSGPVEVRYGWLLLAYVFRSDAPYRFRYPEVSTVSGCEPFVDGTALLTVRGAYLDTGHGVSVTVASGTPCTAVGSPWSDRVLCATDARAVRRAGVQVRLRFNATGGDDDAISAGYELVDRLECALNGDDYDGDGDGASMLVVTYYVVVWLALMILVVFVAVYITVIRVCRRSTMRLRQENEMQWTTNGSNIVIHSSTSL